jgi:hypothetical protein
VIILNHTITWEKQMKTSKHNQVGNFEKLVSFVNAQGAVYNPGKASIKSAALQTLLTQAQGAMQAAYVSRTAYVNAVNARNQALKTVPKMATRIIGGLQASGVSEETLESCKVIKRRFHSPSRKIDSNPAAVGVGEVPPGEKVRRSKSQSDIESVIANFQQLVTMATADALYKPNETDLQAEGLSIYITALHDKVKAVGITRADMKEANRTFHNLIFGTTGIYGQALAVKAYIKSLYGFGSSEYKELAQIKFRNR